MSLFSTLITSKVAAGAIAVSTLAVGGTAAAAVTNTLPDQAQEIAHEVAGAPAPETATAATTTVSTETEADDDAAKADDSSTAKSSTEPSTPSDASSPATLVKGPDATGPAAKGLCTAYTAGGLHNPRSTAYQALATAATQGATTTTADPATAITAYCLTILGPASTDSHPATVPGTASSHSHRSHHHTAAKSDDQGSTSTGSDDSTDQEHSSVSHHKGSSHSEVTKSDDSNDDQGGDDQGENENEGSDD